MGHYHLQEVIWLFQRTRQIQLYSIPAIVSSLTCLETNSTKFHVITLIDCLSAIFSHMVWVLLDDCKNVHLMEFMEVSSL